MELITKHVLGLNIISGIHTRTKTATQLPLKMSPESQLTAQEYLVVLGALVASARQGKGIILVKAGIFHNNIVCCGFCVAFETIEVHSNN